MGMASADTAQNAAMEFGGIERVPDPSDLIDAFQGELRDLFNAWVALVDSVEVLVAHEPYDPQRIARRVTLDAFLRLAIACDLEVGVLAEAFEAPMRFETTVALSTRSTVLRFAKLVTMAERGRSATSATWM